MSAALITVPRSFGGTLLLAPPPLSITIGGNAVVFDEDTFQLSLKLDERWRFQFTVLDYTGTQQFSYRQQVVVTDANLGILFAGFVADVKQDKTNMYPSPGIEHQIDCIDTRGLVDKKTSNWFYANQQAGVIAVHQVQKYLASEGITAAAALRWDELLTDWQAGTLTNTVATTNAYDSNPGDGDLELALAGTAVTKTESTTANWNAGTLTGLQAVSNQLLLNSHAALSFSGSCANNFGNAFAYYQVWKGSYTIKAGDFLGYKMWVNSSSPQIMSGVDGVCSDGTTIRDFNTGGRLTDQNGLNAHPNTDLSGFANDQWYYRKIDISALAGKTLSFATLVFEGDNGGQYQSYFYDVQIENSSGVQQQNLYGTGGLISSVLVPQQVAVKVGANGYSNVMITPIIAYEATGTRISPAVSVAGASIYKSSQIAWAQTLPANTSLAMFTSIDGGVSWQTATSESAILDLMAGASLTGKTITTKQVFSLMGKDPIASPVLTGITWTVYPSYVATKSDSFASYDTQAQWNTGTVTNHMVATTAGDLTPNSYLRNWDDASTANQTLFGAVTPAMGTFKREASLTTGNVADAKARLDAAGTWQDFTMSVDVQITSANIWSGLVYRTTGWVNARDTHAYKADINLNSVNLGRASNGGASGNTVIGTAALSLTVGDWHTLTVVVSGSSHSVYVDGVLYINVVDATYAAAGNVGIILNNSSGSATTGYFDNFGIMDTGSIYQPPPATNTPPTWTGPSISLGSITVGNSIIQWNVDSPLGAPVTVLASVNGGAYAACTDGSVIPGLTPGTVLTSGTLQLRVTLQAAQASAVPVFHGLSAWVSSAFSSSGTRVSPSLSLAPVGSQAGTALVNWNANLPTNTGLTVQTSIDGGSTYQTVSAPGNAIPNITTQPAPLEDSFESNQANYISTFGNGGSVGTWTLDTAHSRIIASGGSDALYLRADNRYAGLTIGINPGIGNAGSPYPFWNLLLPDMAAKGLSTLRFQISWRNIELSQGVYTWTVLDDAVSHCNAAGIRILYTIRDAPTWAKDPANGAVLATTEPYYVMSASLAAGFATQVATRYDGNHGHGVIDVFGFNEDFSIHFTPNSDTFTLNGTVTSGVAITSFPITASTVTPKAGTKVFFGTFSSPDVATVSTDVNVGDTTVHVNSFTPGSTYTATQVLKIGYVGTYNNPNYPGLYGAGDAVTTINKTQPTRDFHFAAPVYTAVYNAIRAVNSTVPIGLPVVWWIQGANPGGTPNTPVSNHTASLQTLYSAGVPMDSMTFVDFHYYTNGVDPTVGNNQTNTIAQVMTDFAAVASANGDAGRQIICTEFGWQADQSTTSSTTIAAGTRTITLASTNGAAIGGTCLIDTVGSGVQETVTITGKTNTTITAVFVNAHTATYPVIISQDCAPTGIDGQDERYTEVMGAIQGAGVSNQFFFYTLDYSTSGPQTSSLVFWNGSSYVYQPAWTSIATYLAAHPGGSSTNTTADVDILVDMDQSDSGGMAWRYINASNFYELAVRDASSPTNPNTVQLYKMVAGVKSAIGPTNPAIKFVRGIPYRVRVTMIGGVITAFFDGVQIATYTDGSPLSAGLSGLRNDTISGASASRYYQLRIQPLGQNVSALSLLTKVTLTSTDPTVTPQLLDMQAFVSSPAIGAGTLIPSASYKRTFVDKNLDDLAKQSNYGWFIDQFKALNFQGRQAVPAPWVLSSNTLAQPSDLEVDTNLLVEIAGDLYRNRQVLTGVIGTAVFTDAFIGDGKATSFTLRYPIAPGTIPTITLDGQAQTVALQGATGANWYYAVGSTTIAQDSSGTVLTDLDTLVVAPYTGTFATEVVVNNLSAQTALALVEGGSGIVEAVEDVSSRNMTLAAATTYANQLLARYCITGRTLTYKTYRNGLAVGQIQSVIVPEEFLQDVQLLLRQIDVTMQTQPNKTVLYGYTVQATELPNVKSWQALIASGLLD